MHDVIQHLYSGRLTSVTILIWTFAAVVLSVGAGAVSGIALGGKDLGNSLAALMGAMYGPVAAVPGILFGLIVLALI